MGKVIQIEVVGDKFIFKITHPVTNNVAMLEVSYDVSGNIVVNIPSIEDDEQKSQPNTFRILRTLKEDRSLRQIDISRKTGISPGSVSASLDSLVLKGLAEKTETTSGPIYHRTPLGTADAFNVSLVGNLLSRRKKIGTKKSPGNWAKIILDTLSEHKGLSGMELCKILDTHRSTVSRVANELVRSGKVIRRMPDVKNRGGNPVLFYKKGPDNPF